MRSNLLLLLSQLAFTIATIPEIPAFTLTWSEDFSGTFGSPPDPSNWIIDTGTSYPGGPANWGTGEVQIYTTDPANIAQSGTGALQITALRDDAGTWTSSRIETVRDDFQAQVGKRMRIQASIAMPDISGEAALGYWPAFRTLGDQFRSSFGNWPSTGEFDIMENVNGINAVWGVLHCGINPGGPCQESQGLGNNLQCPGSPCQGNFHTYTLEVDRSSSPEALRWLVDGVMFHELLSSNLGEDTWNNIAGHGHFVLLNLAMGGAFPDGQHGGPALSEATVPGASMVVDYVAVYNN